MDLLVEKKVVAEIKFLETLNDVPLAQVFNVALLKNGISRVVNDFHHYALNSSEHKS